MPLCQYRYSYIRSDPYVWSILSTYSKCVLYLLIPINSLTFVLVLDYVNSLSTRCCHRGKGILGIFLRIIDYFLITRISTFAHTEGLTTIELRSFHFQDFGTIAEECVLHSVYTYTYTNMWCVRAMARCMKKMGVAWSFRWQPAIAWLQTSTQAQLASQLNLLIQPAFILLDPLTNDKKLARSGWGKNP